jgi:hypothetical protein
MSYVRLYRCTYVSSHDRSVEEVASEARRTNLDSSVRDLVGDLDCGLIVNDTTSSGRRLPTCRRNLQLQSSG